MESTRGPILAAKLLKLETATVRFTISVENDMVERVPCLDDEGSD
jgi:hypothetical protein